MVDDPTDETIRSKPNDPILCKATGLPTKTNSTTTNTTITTTTITNLSSIANANNTLLFNNTDGSTIINECQDCRETSIEDVYTAHFTICGKPYWCPNPKRWFNKTNQHLSSRLCMEFHKAWHVVRADLETKWMTLYPSNSNSSSAHDDTSGYQPNLADLSKKKVYPEGVKHYLKHYQLRHCSNAGRKGYRRLRFPKSFYNPTSTTPLLWQ